MIESSVRSVFSVFSVLWSGSDFELDPDDMTGKATAAGLFGIIAMIRSDLGSGPGQTLGPLPKSELKWDYLTETAYFQVFAAPMLVLRFELRSGPD